MVAAPGLEPGTFRLSVERSKPTELSRFKVILYMKAIINTTKPSEGDKMKLHEILHEMAWPDKYYHFERMVRDKRMSIGELKHYMDKKWNMELRTVPDQNLPPKSSGSASIETYPESPGGIPHPDRPTTKEHRRVLQIHVSPDVKDFTAAAEVSGLIDSLLKHEMSHYRQALRRPPRHWGGYVMPQSGDLRDPTVSGYTLQTVERAPQIMDMATAMAVLQVPPSSFEESVDRIKKKILSDNPPPVEAIHQLAYSEVAGEFEDKHGFRKARELAVEVGVDEYIRRVASKVAQMAVMRAILELDPNIPKEIKRMYRGQYHQFVKGIKKQYPKVRGYYSRHEDEFLRGLKKHQPARKEFEAQQRGQLEQLMDMLRAAQERAGD